MFIMGWSPAFSLRLMFVDHGGILLIGIFKKICIIIKMDLEDF